MLPFYRDIWDFDYPRRIMDQEFGLGLFDRDLLPPMRYRGYLIRPRTEGNISSSGSSEVVKGKDNFQFMLNVKQFKPEEISVKTVDNSIVIHGKHEEKQDEHGFISREFTRRYMLPPGVEPETVSSSLSPDGVLTVTAPRKALEPAPENERVVPITVQQPAAVESSQTEGGQ